MRWKRGASVCRGYPGSLARAWVRCHPANPLPPPPDVHRSHIPHRPSSWLSTPPTEDVPTSVAVSPLRLEMTPSSAPASPRNLPACALDPGIADLRRHLLRGRRRGPLPPDHCCRAQTSSSIKSPPSHPLPGLTFSLPSRHSHHQPPHSHPIPSPSPIPPESPAPGHPARTRP